MEKGRPCGVGANAAVMSLGMGGDWVCPTNSTHRFFKVTVEMP